MKFMSCFLLMSAILLAMLTGCASAPTPKAPEAKPASGRPPPGETAAQKPATQPPGDLYASIEDSPLARSLRGEFVLASTPLPFTCFATGKFNIGPGRKHLLMKMICVHESDQGIVAMPVEDTMAEPLEGKPYLFDVPFQRTLVSVADQDGETEVVLHYKDDHGEFHHIRLEPRPGARYEYDFDKPLEEVRPFAAYRMMRAEQ